MVRDSLLPRRSPGMRLTGIWPGDRVESVMRTRLFRRGRERRASFEASSRFPLGLFEVKSRGPIHDTGSRGGGDGLLVYPQPMLPEALRQDLEQAHFEASFPWGNDPDPGGEFRGVRAYRSGDSVKAVHWGATARSAGLMVREWDPPAPRP